MLPTVELIRQQENKMDRAAHLNNIATTEFDICIIGAGASGAGCALDAALRGYRVLLIDKTDFAAETSSKSTKLIHGGVRYLEQAFKNFDFAQLRQVRHGLEERHNLLNNAPHLARPLALITPVFSWFEGLYFTIGLKVYGLFAKNDTLPKATWLSRKQTFENIPSLTQKLHSSVMYYDGQLDDARYCLALVQSAAQQGASIANYLEIVQFSEHTGGGIKSAIGVDKITENEITIKAKIFINCTGATADVVRKLANPLLSSRIRPSKGVHLVLPDDVLKGNAHALMIPKTPDGRLLFVIPFEHSVFVGTTDDDYKNPDEEPILNQKEVHFILETLRPYFERAIEPQEVTAGFGGLRPLITENKANTKNLLRDHEVEHDPVSNLVSLLGGKWTTYRVMAKDTIDKVEGIWKPTTPPTPCTTAAHTLVGGENLNDQKIVELIGFIAEKYNLSNAIAAHLVSKYGNLAENVIHIAGEKGFASFDLLSPLTPQYPHLKAEVLYAVRYEMAVKPRDFLARRTRLEIMNWQIAHDICPVVCQIMSIELRWTAEKTQQEIMDYQHQINTFQAAIQ